MVQAMRAAFDVLGGQPPGLGLRSLNAIPHGRGLGSSAAAIVTGILAARGLARDGARPAARRRGARPGRRPGGPPGQRGRLPARRPDHLLDARAGPAAGRRPGNGAAPGRPARSPHGPPAGAGGDPAGGLRAEESLATQTARGALPAAVPHRDAAANAARSALLVAALTRIPDVLFDATEDFLHQPYRAAVMPRTADLLGRLRAAGVAAVVSGAGPSVLAFTVAGRPALTWWIQSRQKRVSDGV